MSDYEVHASSRKPSVTPVATTERVQTRPSRWHRTFYFARLPASLVMASLVYSMHLDGLSKPTSMVAMVVLLLWPHVWFFIGRVLLPRRRGSIHLVAADGILLTLIPFLDWGLPILNLGATAIVINTIMTGGLRLLRNSLIFIAAGLLAGTLLWGAPVSTSVTYSTRTWLLSTAALVFEGILAASIAIRANVLLTEAKRALAELNRVLDQRVLERTAALASTNAAISRFVPKEFLQALGHSDVSTAKLGDAVAKEITVLFADIRHFTTISEQLTPQQTFHFLNTCLSRIGPHIRAQSGFVDKYIGDAIMALFPESPAHAVRAAIAMQTEVEQFNSAHLESKPLAIGVGIHMGRVMMGTIGESERFEATVISDAVNLTARLETLTKQLGCAVIASADVVMHLTAAELEGTRKLGRFALKGKRKPVELVEIFLADPAALRNSKQGSKTDFLRGLQHYEDGQVKEAAEAFRRVAALCADDGPARFWTMRCESALERGEPIADGGVITLEQK